MCCKAPSSVTTNLNLSTDVLTGSDLRRKGLLLIGPILNPNDQRTGDVYDLTQMNAYFASNLVLLLQVWFYNNM